MDWENIILERPSYNTAKKKSQQLRSRKNSQQPSFLEDFTPLAKNNKNKSKQSDYNITLMKSSNHQAILPDIIKTDRETFSGQKILVSQNYSYKQRQYINEDTISNEQTCLTGDEYLYNNGRSRPSLQLKDLQTNQHNSRTLMDKMKRRQLKPFNTVAQSPIMKDKYSNQGISLQNQDLKGSQLNKQQNKHNYEQNANSEIYIRKNQQQQQSIVTSPNHFSNININTHSSALFSKQLRTSQNKSNFNSTISMSQLSQNVIPQSLDKDYDQSMVGPGSYKGSNWSTFELISGQKDSKVHKNKPGYQFGTSKRSNEKQFISKEQWIQENKMNNSPPVGSYDPNYEKIQQSITKQITIKDYPARFDNYSFKKMLENSPSEFHEIKDPRDISFTDPHKTQTQTFTQGKRLGFPLQRDQNDLVPSPDKYNLKSVFEINKNKAFLIDKPREQFISKQFNTQTIDTSVSKRIEEERNRGPGMYEIDKVGKGILSQSQSVRTFQFVKSDRNYEHMRTGDKYLNVSPGQYYDQQSDFKSWNKNGSGLINISEAYQKPKDFDIRKYDQSRQIERLSNKRPYF